MDGSMDDFRMYRRLFLRSNTRWNEPDEIYLIEVLLHFSELNTSPCVPRRQGASSAALHRCTEVCASSFSAVSVSIFASKFSFFSIFEIHKIIWLKV